MAVSNKVEGLERALTAIERRVYEVAYERAHRRTLEIVAHARSKWPFGNRPKNRKRSKYLWRIEDKSNGTDNVRFVINNDARDARGTPYAWYIRSAQVPGAGKRNAWVVLVRRPTLRMLGQLADETVRDPTGRG
jgi:hypothetical protein